MTVRQNRVRIAGRPARWLAGLLAVAGTAAGAAGTVVPTFSAGSSALVGTHDPDGPGGTAAFSSPLAVPAASGPATLIAPFNGSGNIINFAGGSTKAKAGAGHTEGSNLAKITFPAGLGIDQTDPGHVQPTSVLTFDFSFVWNISNGTLGPPINANFSVPVGASVGPGGSARFLCDVHWDAVVNGVTMLDRRTPYSAVQSFGPGTTLTSFSSPAAAFSPSSIPDAAGVDSIRVRGFVQFEVNNDTTRSVIEVLGKDPQDGRVNTDFATELQANPEFLYEAGTGFEEVQTPEPSGVLVSAAGSLLVLTRRRRSASSHRLA